MTNTFEYPNDEYNEIRVKGSNKTVFVVSRNYFAAGHVKVNADKALSFEMHGDGYDRMNHLTIELSFEEAIDIFKHVQVLYREYEEKGLL